MIYKLTLPNGVQFTYHDSGAPDIVSRGYKTIFAIHGAAFTGAVWSKVISIAPDHGVRFVAVNRRGYSGSSDYSEEEIEGLSQGSDEDKAEFLRARGHEVLTFIDTFITQEDLPEISEDGKSGGIGIVGWSIGNVLSFAAIANADSIVDKAKARLVKRLRGLIMHEPSSIIIGERPSPKGWTPSFDQSIPEDERFFVFIPWISSYFEHKSITSRDRDDISYAKTSLTTTPTIYNMTKDDQARILVCDGQGNSADVLQAINLFSQMAATYQKAVFDKKLREMFPHLKVGLLIGTLAPATAIVAHWVIEDENEKREGGFVKFKYLGGGNHISQWDDPEGTLKGYIELLG